MKLPAVRYPALLGASIVAGVFSVIVVLLMAIDFAGRGSLELFDEPQYVTLKEQLRKNPNDAQVIESLRQLDQQLRQSYFRHRQFMQRGVWLLIGGLIVCLATARWAAALRRVLPQPIASDEEVDQLPQQQRWGRRGAAVLTAALLLLLTGLVLQSQRVLPRSVDELALELTPAKTDQQQTTTSTQNKQSPTDPGTPHPRPDQSQHPDPQGPPTYQQYQQQWPRFRGPTGSGASALDGPAPEMGHRQRRRGLVETGGSVAQPQLAGGLERSYLSVRRNGRSASDLLLPRRHGRAALAVRTAGRGR